MTAVGVIGAGRIGSMVARHLTHAGHDVVISFSRDQDRLTATAVEIGARAGTPQDAAGADVVILSVPWTAIDDVVAQVDLDDKIVVDTTNQFGANGWEEIPGGLTAAQLNQRRMPGARYVKSFNTLTAAFQASEAGRPAESRVVQWICGDDEDAKATVAQLIRDAGFEPVDVGGVADAAVMEAPRREGSVYGEEYRPADARAVVEAVRAGRPIPPTPRY
ncbi:MAG TPA: NAD(P)-binding domain-containing protein [Solirubrobacteraceae bacterium]|nr:NAD(P)-binding domain-containing protein [Solirubrobacteraceae bacterium]